MEKVMEKQSAMALLNKRSDAYLFSHFGTEIVRAFEPRDQSGMQCQYSSSAFLFSRINTDYCARRALDKTVYSLIHFIAFGAFIRLCACAFIIYPVDRFGGIAL